MEPASAPPGPQARPVLELDGSQHFERSDYDERRTAFLERRGYRVLRFWNIDVLKHVDQVLEAIDAALVDPSMSGRLDRSNLPPALSGHLPHMMGED